MALHFAPRYEPRLLDLIRSLDDRNVPIAEVCRRIGAAAEREGLPRPSYAHVRRYIHAERTRADNMREVIDDVAARLVVGRFVDAYYVAEQVRDARAVPRHLDSRQARRQT